MKQIVELFIIHVEIVVVKEFSKLRDTNLAFFMVVNVLKSIIWLYVFDLFSKHLHNSKSFEDFNQQRNEVTLYFSSQGSTRGVDRLHLPAKRYEFI